MADNFSDRLISSKSMTAYSMSTLLTPSSNISHGSPPRTKSASPNESITVRNSEAASPSSVIHRLEFPLEKQWKSSLNLSNLESNSPNNSANERVTILKNVNDLKSNFVSPFSFASLEAPAKLSSSPDYRRARCRSLSLSEESLFLSEQRAAGFLLLDAFKSNSSEDRSLSNLIKEAESGFDSNSKLEVADGAMGGTYFLTNAAGKKVLVCKPADEEPNSPNNPHHEKRERGRSWESYKGKITPGFGMYREIAVYVLDDKFSGIPKTTLAKIRHPSFCRKEEEKHTLIADSESELDSKPNSFTKYKCCALQIYVDHKYVSDDVGYLNFITEEVQRIATLDIRVCNLDRHGGNLLVRGNKQMSSSPLSSIINEADNFHLVPIDHGYCLPHINYMSDATFVWMTWPQVKQPVSATVIDYINAIDIERNIDSIEKMVGAAIPDTSLLTLRFCTMYLKKGISAGLTLFEIGSQMIARFDDIDDFNIDFCGTSNLQRSARRAIRQVLAEMYAGQALHGKEITGSSSTSIRPLNPLISPKLTALSDANIIKASHFKSIGNNKLRLLEVMEFEIDILIEHIMAARPGLKSP